MSEYVDGAFYWCLFGDAVVPARWYGPDIGPRGDEGGRFWPWGYEEDTTWPAPDKVGPMIGPPAPGAAGAWHSPERGPHRWLTYARDAPPMCSACGKAWAPGLGTEPCPGSVA